MAKKKQAKMSLSLPGASLVQPEEMDAFTAEHVRQAEFAKHTAQELLIQKPADREFASKALATVAGYLKSAEEKRIGWVKPLKTIAADIDATFRPGNKLLKEAEIIFKQKIGAWDVLQAQERARLLTASTQAAAAGDQSAAARAYEKAEDHVVEQGTATTKVVWTGEVIDAALIPREYLVPDVAKLEAITRAMDKDPQIPGWRAFQTGEVRTSRKGAA